MANCLPDGLRRWILSDFWALVANCRPDAPRRAIGYQWRVPCNHFKVVGEPFIDEMHATWGHSGKTLGAWGTDEPNISKKCLAGWLAGRVLENLSKTAHLEGFRINHGVPPARTQRGW